MKTAVYSRSLLNVHFKSILTLNLQFVYLRQNKFVIRKPYLRSSNKDMTSTNLTVEDKKSH